MKLHNACLGVLVSIHDIGDNGVCVRCNATLEAIYGNAVGHCRPSEQEPMTIKEVPRVAIPGEKFPRIPVLDGYVRLVEYWGVGDAGCSEAGIVEAARQSTQGSFRGWTEDEKLLRTLAKSEPAHAGPFEFAGMVVEVEAPIMVFREWHRHRTQGYNEMSARYAPLPNKDYVPTVDRCFGGLIPCQACGATGIQPVTNHPCDRCKGTGKVRSRNKQQAAADGAVDLTEEYVNGWLAELQGHQIELENFYQRGLANGIPKELARLALTFGRYSRMRSVANFRNWVGFLKLRNHPMAQWEIQQYAKAVSSIMEEIFPRSWVLFNAK